MSSKLVYVAESQLADQSEIKCVGFAYGTGKSHSLRAAIEEAEKEMLRHMQELGATIVVGSPAITSSDGGSCLVAVSCLVARYDDVDTAGQSED